MTSFFPVLIKYDCCKQFYQMFNLTVDNKTTDNKIKNKQDIKGLRKCLMGEVMWCAVMSCVRVVFLCIYVGIHPGNASQTDGLGSRRQGAVVTKWHKVKP